MSSSHHDDQYLQEQKPITFTVPFILASVLILIIFLFVSLCDPKPHHVVDAEHHEQMAPGAATAHSDAMEAHENGTPPSEQPSMEHH